MKRFITMSLLAGLLMSACVENAEINVVSLRCEGIENPVGIDLNKPRLGWIIRSDSRNIMQTSYHILVASSLEKLDDNTGDVWDSGNVKSDLSVFVQYAGAALESEKEYFWKVKVQTNKGVSAWSDVARFSVGLLNKFDQNARWIGYETPEANDVTEGNTRLVARYLRKKFNLKSAPVQKASLYISGLGLYEAYINGKRVGEQVLAPTPTDYDKVVKYNTFDVTEFISSGDNSIGVILGNGRYFGMRSGRQVFDYPKLLLQLKITYANGESQLITSNNDWKISTDGPIRANNEYDGEEYDARINFNNWNLADFDDSAWKPAELVDAPKGYLEAQLNPNIKIMETIQPVSISRLKDDVYILDVGQNMVGWLKMKNVNGKSGKEIKLRFAETLSPDGSLFLANLRGALVTDKYIMNGAKDESWEPSFVYHGFRYVEITGFPGIPTVNNFEGKVAYDEMPVTGYFETSDSTINQIYNNAYWGIRGNYRGMPTDCPQRDERMGWLGDRAVGSLGESFIFGNHALYSKWLDDIEQSQREDGSVPDVAPNYWMVYSDNMTWPGAYVIIADMLYRQYGDVAPIAKHYDSMKKWIEYMRKNYLRDNILTKDTYGDWCMPPESPELIHSQDPARKTDGALLSTAFYYRILKHLAGFAEMLNKPDDATAFSNEANVIRDAFNAKYFNAETKQYSNNTVTANILPLYFGITPNASREAVFGNIANKTEKEFNSHVSVGLVGIQCLMRCLTEYGRPDIALRIATNRDYPSWGYMIERGATTIWELWNGDTADPGMNSGNHVMLLGDLVVWFYENLAGIRNNPAGAGFKEIEMKPSVINGLDYVTASYNSVRGTIVSAWRKNGQRFEWDVTIPCNSTATVYIPAANSASITENGVDIKSVKGIKYVGVKDNCAVYKIGSGTYRFASEL